MRHILKHIQYLLPAVILSIFLCSDLCTASVIKVKEKSIVSNETIYLKDIIMTDISDDMMQKISDIKIGSSPQPGKKKNIPVSLIKSRIKSVISDDELRIHMPEKLATVERASQTLSEASLKKLYIDYVKKRLTGKKFTISKINIKGNKELPTGELGIEVEDNPEKNISGHYRLIVNAVPIQGNKRRILISGWIDRYEKVVFAKKEIPKGGKIYSKDLYTEMTNITKYPSDIFYSTTGMIGQVAKTRIRKNVLIRQKMLGVSPAVKKGDMVKMTARSGPLTVVTIGQAIENARVGEQVKIRNMKSKKVVTGFVLESNMVEVVF